MPGLPGGSQTPQGRQYSQALGSGFVWDQKGDIVTNNHVVDGANKVEVTYSDGTTVPAKVIGKDINSDLAVIKVDTPADQLRPVQFADSTQVKVGELAIAIGNPFGLQGTMTVGIVSALGRTLPAGEANQTGLTYTIPDIIQTDAPINPGNSGGVLVNDQGQVIGVTSAIESPVQANAGIGFAIPSTLVQKVIPALIKNGTYEHPYLGISGTPLTPDLAKAMNLKADQRGALVEDVTSGGPSDKAGLHGSDRQVTIDGQDIGVGGDIIIAVNNMPINKMDDIIAYLTDQTEVGQKISLTVLRNGKEVKLDVILEARPANTATSTSSNATTNPVWIGIQGLQITPDIAHAMNLPESQRGILIEQVEAGGPADKAGLKASSRTENINGQSVPVGGDVIIAIDDQNITTVDELQAFLWQAQPGQNITLTVLRDGKRVEVPLTLAERPQ
jgi:S1-C subfamily serine protease